MIKFLFKNRTALQIFLVTTFLLVGYNVTNSIADNVEINTIDAVSYTHLTLPTKA